MSDVAAILKRAGEIAVQRHPNGCGATALADIVREAARELGLTNRRRPSSARPPNPNAGRHNRLELLPAEQQAEARRICTETTNANFPGLPPCTDKGFVCYRCQDEAALRARASGETE
jgi:hypothetical protein